MCGINGIFSSKVSELDNLVGLMNDSISHRGPDAHGVKLCSLGALGHARLSILDLSTAANQPFYDENYILAYNGEVYNFEELRLKYDFKCETTSDTEVIFHGLKLKGEAFLEELNGMFALAFWNAQSEELLVARDRLGIKPLYYFNDDKGFAFSSELKGLKAIKSKLGGFSINENAVNSFFAFRLHT